MKKLLNGLSRSAPQADARWPLTFQRLDVTINCLPAVARDSYVTILSQLHLQWAFGSKQIIKRCHERCPVNDLSIKLPAAHIYLAGDITVQTQKWVSMKDTADETRWSLSSTALCTFKSYRPSGQGHLFIHTNRSPGRVTNSKPC